MTDPGAPRETVQPLDDKPHAVRRRLGVRDELVLAAFPTITVLVVLVFVDVLSQQRLLFASLASSAFLIYLDPEHATNSVRTLVTAQIGSALIGWGLFALLGPGYMAGGLAMVVTIGLMIVLDVVHPPAVATAMSFALRAGDERDVVIFGLAVAITAALVVLQRVALWLATRAARHVRRWKG
ncbi:MAG TPA: HPP family protein [Gemmatimonadales bacterium]